MSRPYGDKPLQERRVRERLSEDLMAFLDADVHLAGYLVAWICRTAPVADVAGLVEGLNDLYRRDGRQILPPHIRMLPDGRLYQGED